MQTYNDDGVIDTYTYGLQRIDSKGQTNETYLYDGRGSVAGTLNADNEFVSYSYTAYGELMPSSSQPHAFGYNCEQTDFQTGIQYLRARYYDTTLGRFFQEDDYKGKYTRPFSMNRYAYTEGNPVMGSDPSGYVTKQEVDAAFDEMVAIGTTIQGYQNSIDTAIVNNSNLNRDKESKIEEMKEVIDNMNALTNKINNLTMWQKMGKDDNEIAAEIARLYNVNAGLVEDIKDINSDISDNGQLIKDANDEIERLTPLHTEARDRWIMLDEQYGNRKTAEELLEEYRKLSKNDRPSFSDYWWDHNQDYLISPIPDEFDYKHSGDDVFKYDRGDRVHAGIDFTTAPGTPVVAMEDGEVIKIKDKFLQESDAVIIVGETGCTILYGEIDPSVKEGDIVKQGDIIGTVAKNYTKRGDPMSMLHLEVYSGALSGDPIIYGYSPYGYKYVKDSYYERRKDLINPTRALDLTRIKIAY